MSNRKEGMNIRAKCFRYRGCVQWAIIGGFAILLVHLAVNTNLLSFAGRDVRIEKGGKKNLDSLKVAENTLKPNWHESYKEAAKKLQEAAKAKLGTKSESSKEVEKKDKKPEDDNNLLEKNSSEEKSVKKGANSTKTENKTRTTNNSTPVLKTNETTGKNKNETKGKNRNQEQPGKAQDKSTTSPDKTQAKPKSGSYKFPFLDPTKTWKERVEDLVGRMTIDEAIGQTQAVYKSRTPAINRLLVKPYMWIAECLHGYKGSQGTSYPQAVGLAATFSPDMVLEAARTISYEARAIWNRNVQKSEYKTMNGLTCFSPTINILRHPMWGRNQETYGEDPHLTGVIAEAFVRGLQGSHERYVRAAATCKHFAAHDGPEKYPVNRLEFDAVVKESDMRMTYLPAFKTCVEAGALGVMCSYNRINGVPACAHKPLLNGTLRGEWGFQGYVVSDANAVDYMLEKHKYKSDVTEVAAAALGAGVNLELAGRSHVRYTNLQDALKRKLVTEAQIRENVKPLMMTRMRLGEFDPPEMNPYNKINMSFVQSPRHRALAVKLASASFVLLKNEKNVLPIVTDKLKDKLIVVIGPVAQMADKMYGSYAPTVNGKYAQSPKDGLQRLGNNVKFEKICDDLKCSDYDQRELRSVTMNAALVIVTMVGAGEGEFHDRSGFAAPGKYRKLLEQLPRMTEGKIVLLVFSGAAVQLDWAQEHPNISAIMQCFMPGQGAGDALYNTLTAQSPDAVPAARLPYSWPTILDKMPKITNYSMEAGFTYRYNKEKPLYPFGYGLSYTKFRYENLVIEPTRIDPKSKMTISVTVQNIGSLEADEVVQVYVSWVEAKAPSLPKLQLVAFKRLRIRPASKETVRFEIPAQKLMVWSTNNKFELLPGKMKVFVGGQQPDQTMSVGSNVLTGDFTASS